ARTRLRCLAPCKWSGGADLITLRHRRRRWGKRRAATLLPIPRVRRRPVPYSRHMPLMCRVLSAALALSLSLPIVAVAAQASAPVAGRVKTVIGSASIVRDGQTMAAVIGMEVLASDRLRTGSDGRLALTLKDDTRLSLGPDTEVSLDEFAFAPAEGRLSMVLRMVK